MCVVKTGGQAFPGQISAGYDTRDGKEWFPGMTLRDYFAGQFAAGIMDTIINGLDESQPDEQFAKDLQSAAIGIAATSYALADAMIWYREQPLKAPPEKSNDPQKPV